MKTLEIEINGTASEVVVGRLTKEELNRIHQVMQKNDLIDEDSYDYTSFFYDSSLVSEADVSEWYETDSFLHQHGPYASGQITVRNFDTGEELYSGDLNELFKKDEYGPEKYEFSKADINEDEVLFHALTTEKGTPFCGRIEVEDDHVFDIELLSFSRISAEIDDYHLCEIIEYIIYNDEDVDNDYYQTYGKDFEIDIVNY